MDLMVVSWEIHVELREILVTLWNWGNTFHLFRSYFCFFRAQNDQPPILEESKDMA
jgi:hypothetical protein